MSGYFENGSQLKYKFKDFALYLENPKIVEDASTGTGGRAARYPMLWRVFLGNPLFGDASYKSRYGYDLAHGGHLYWMSRLALWGILGFIGYLLILKNIFKPVVNIFDPKFKFYYQLSLMSIFTLGLMKNLTLKEPLIMLLIIIPGLYLLQYSFDENSPIPMNSTFSTDTKN